MHRLFDKDVQVNYGNMRTERFDRFSDIALRNMQRTEEHLRSRNYSVASNHVICKLLKMMPLPSVSSTQLSSDDVRKYYDMIRINDYRYANMVSMVSSTNYGAIRKSQFYSKAVDEIIIGTSSRYDEVKSIPWEDLEPIRVHRHPYNSTYYGILDGRQPLPEKGVAVISVDIPVLALQYMKWMLEENKRMKEEGNTPTILGTFITRYPLCNMLKSHNDIACINRTINAWRGIRNTTPQPRQAFWLHDDMGWLDTVIDRLIPELKRTPRYFDATLLHLPAVYRTGYDAIRLPVDIDLRQNRWAWLVGRMWIIGWLLETEMFFKSKNKEGVKMNEIQHQVQRINNDNLFMLSNLTKQIKSTIAGDLDLINKQLAKR